MGICVARDAQFAQLRDDGGQHREQRSREQVHGVLPPPIGISQVIDYGSSAWVHVVKDRQQCATLLPGNAAFVQQLVLAQV